MQRNLPIALLLIMMGVIGVAAADEAARATTAAWDDLLKDGFVYMAATMETWLRAFSLGFGAHMLVYIFQNADAKYDDLKVRFRVSVVCGVAMGCFVFGASMVLPTNMRQHWFDSD